MVALEDVQTQRNGITSVVFAVGDSIRRPMDSGIFLKTMKLLETAPSIVGGIHFCYEDEFTARAYPTPIKLVQMAVDTLTRTKFRGKSHHFC